MLLGLHALFNALIFSAFYKYLVYQRLTSYEVSLFSIHVSQGSVFYESSPSPRMWGKRVRCALLAFFLTHAHKVHFLHFIVLFDA